MLVTLVGCSCSRSPITRIGRPPVVGEGQQHQRLVAGEGQAVRPERAVDGGLQDLLHPHHAGHRGHRARTGRSRSSQSSAARAMGSNGSGFRVLMVFDASSVVAPAGLWAIVCDRRCADRRRSPGSGRRSRCGRWRRRRAVAPGVKRGTLAVLVAFSVAPSGGGNGQCRRAVADAVRVVRESGLAERDDLDVHHDRGAEWDEVMEVVKRASRRSRPGRRGQPGAQGRHPARLDRPAAGEGRAGGAGAR